MDFQRTLGARAVHAVLFEIGLVMAMVPLAAWWLDIAIVLFFLPYTFAFNWTYDHLRSSSSALASTSSKRPATDR